MSDTGVVKKATAVAARQVAAGKDTQVQVLSDPTTARRTSPCAAS